MIGGRIRNLLKINDSCLSYIGSGCKWVPFSEHSYKQKLFSIFRTVEVDYDTDGSGLYRAKHHDDLDAKEIMDSSRTKIDLPVDHIEADEVDEEEEVTERVRSMRLRDY